jgi:DNA uptake protein ComE-like DNA-binding protein
MPRFPFTVFTAPQEDPRQQRPEFPAFLSDMPRRMPQADFGASELARRTTRTSRTVAQNLLGQREQPEQVLPRHEAVPPPGGTPTRQVIMGHIRAGWQMVVAGSGGLMTMLPNLPAGVTAEAVERLLPGGLGSALSLDELEAQAVERGHIIRRRADQQRLAEKAMNAPDGWVEEALAIVAEQVPLMMVMAAGSAVTGYGAAAAGFSRLASIMVGTATAGATIYGVEKAGVQTELEESGATPQEAEIVASLAAIPIALTEGLVPGILGSRVVRKLAGMDGVVGKGTKKTLARHTLEFLRSVGEGAVGEGFTEALQEAQNIAAVMLTTDREFSAEEVRERLMHSAIAGAVAGGAFGGAFGAVGQTADEINRRTEERRTQLNVEAAAGFDPRTVPPGGTIGGKQKSVDKNGREYWHEADNRLARTKPPTKEEVEQAAREGLDVALLVESAAAATDTSSPMDVAVKGAANTIAQLSGRNIDGQTVELNIRKFSADYRLHASSELNRLSKEQLESEMAMLESIALDPTSSTPYAVRVMAMSKKRALEHAQRGAENPEAVSVSVGARQVAGWDNITFDAWAANVEASGREVELRVLHEARAIRALGPEDIKGQPAITARDQLKSMLLDMRTKQHRGVLVGQRVTTADGNVGQVVTAEPSGTIAVELDGSAEPVLMDPSTVTIIPEPNQTVQMATGQTGTVKEVSDAGILIDFGDGVEEIIVADEVERIVPHAPPESPEAAVAPTSLVSLPQPVPQVDTRTGATVAVAAVSPTEVQLTDGTLLPREAIAPLVQNYTIPDIATTGVIPTLQPGTRPAEGRHISFVNLSPQEARSFEGASKQGVVPDAFLTRLSLLPQPLRADEVMYAVELPTDARKLDGPGKRLLGFLSGKQQNLPLGAFRSQVSVTRTLQPEEVGLMRVPESLAQVVLDQDATRTMTPAERQSYVQRLADLNFQMDEPTGRALMEAKLAAARAADAREAGRIGEAEVAEIEADTAVVEAAQVAIEQNIAARRKVWDAVKEELQSELDPEHRGVLQALNSSLYDDLVEIPGIDEKLAEKILTERKKQGGSFGNLTDLMKVKSVGPKRLEQIIEAVAEQAPHMRGRIGVKRAEKLKKLLKELPGRRTDELTTFMFTFEHPTNPGFYLAIDKEIVQTAVDTGLRPDPDIIRSAAAVLEPEELVNISRAQLTERPIYHIRAIAPDGTEVISRTLGHGISENVLVPEHTTHVRTDSRGFTSTSFAVREINAGLARGEPLNDIVERLKSELRTTRKVKLADKVQALAWHEGKMVPATQLSEEELEASPHIVLAEEELKVVSGSRKARGVEVETETVERPGSRFATTPTVTEERGRVTESGREARLMVVEDAEGNRFEVNPTDVVESSVEEEALVPIGVPRRLSEDESLDELLHQVMRFGTKAKLMAVGEWVSDVPGVYATIHESPQGFQVVMFSEPVDRKVRRPRTYDFDNIDIFTTREEAAEYLEVFGFKENPVQREVTKLFSRLPAVESLTRGNIHHTHTDLLTMLKIYKSEGFVPQTLRDYVARFAQRWNDLQAHHHSGIFGSRDIRRLVDLYEVKDAYYAARSTQPGARVTPTGVTDRLTVSGLPEIHTGEQLGNDVRVLDGMLMSSHIPPAHPARLETTKALNAAIENRERFLDLVGTDGDASVTDVADRLVEIGPEKRLGIVINSRPGHDGALVQVFEGTTPVVSTIDKSKLTRVRSPDKALDYYRAVRGALGELRNYPRIPEMGLSVRDREIGNVGIQDREAYIPGLAMHIRNNVQLAKIAEDGTINGPKRHVDNLVNAYIRMKELGIAQSDLPENSRIPPALLGKKGRGPLVQLAYEQVKKDFIGMMPYGEIMAQAKLDMLPPSQRDSINEQAREWKLDPNLPLWRKVEQLIQNVWNPDTADLIYQMRSDLGAVNFGAQLPSELFEIRHPPRSSIIRINSLTAQTMMPRTFASRHPTFRIAYQMWEKARTNYGREWKRGADVIRGLQARTVHLDLNKKRFVRDLLESPTLGEAMRSPSHVLTQTEVETALGKDNFPKDWDWYTQYKTIREFLSQGLRDNIWNALVRGFHLNQVPLGTGDARDNFGRAVDIMTKFGVKPDELKSMIANHAAGLPVFIIERTSNPKYARPRDEAAVFLDLWERYETLADIPAEIQTEMSEWMREEFDMWRRYGSNSYMPVVIQGRHIVKMKEADGKEHIVALVPDGTAAIEYIRRFKNGQIPGHELNQTKELVVEFRRAVADDIDMAFLGPERLKKLYAWAVKDTKSENEASKLMNRIAHSLRVGGKRAMPKNIHTLPRSSDLDSIIEDPYRQILLYWGRTQRNNYLLEVEHGYWTAHDADAAISKAHGIDAIFPSLRGATAGHQAASKYMADLRDSYMGEPNERDNITTQFAAFVEFLHHLPDAAARKLKAKLTDSNYDIYSDPDFLDTLYSPEFKARSLAERYTGLQSVWRLGLNIAGSAVNSLQNMAFTPAYLITKGVDAHKAVGYSVRGQTTDAVSFHKEGGHGRLTALIDDAGTVNVPTRGAAGPGLGIMGEDSPLFFSDTPRTQQFVEMFKWIAMWPFSRAERSVRLGSSFAAMRAAEDMGLSRDATVAFMRDVVDNTQFQYYDQALPPIMRGPMMRVLLQFQQFVVNAAKFDVDLLRATFGTSGTFQGQSGMRAQAAKALAYRMIANTVLGGGAALASWPVFAALYGILSWGDDSEEAFMNSFGQAERRHMDNYGTEVGDPEFGSLWNAVRYGAPGLLDLQISARIGVSGLSLSPTKLLDLATGPTGSMYADIIRLYAGEGGLTQTDPRSATILGMSALALSNRTSVPYPLAFLAVQQAAQWADTFTPLKNDLSRFVTESESGRAFLRSMSPTLARGIRSTIDVFGDPNHVTYDDNFQERRYPGFGNALFESATNTLGFQTIREAEERALLSYKFKDQQEQQQLRRSAIQVGAEAAARNGIYSPEVVEVIKHSVARGAPINYVDIEQALQDQGRSAIDAANQRAALWRRSMGRNSPSYRPGR